MNRGDLAIFALSASRDFGEAVSGHLGVALSPQEEREFEDGEHKTRPLVSVRGKDVFVIHSLYGDSQQTVNDKLCRFLFFLGALKDASAEHVTAVIPYLCYARKDKKSKARDPVTTRYVARLFEAVGVDHAIALDVHNVAAFQNAWRSFNGQPDHDSKFTDVSDKLDRSVNWIDHPDTGSCKACQVIPLLFAQYRVLRKHPLEFACQKIAGGAIGGGYRIARSFPVHFLRFRIVIEENRSRTDRKFLRSFYLRF